MSDRQYFPAHDTVFDEDVLVIYWFPPTFQPANPAGAAAYFAVPTVNDLYALCLWNDNSIHVQSLNNIVAKVY